MSKESNAGPSAEIWTKRRDQALEHYSYWRHEYADFGDPAARQLMGASELLLHKCSDELEKVQGTQFVGYDWLERAGDERRKRTGEEF